MASPSAIPRGFTCMEVRALNHDLEHRRGRPRVGIRWGFMSGHRTNSTRIAILTCLLFVGRASFAQDRDRRGGFERGGFGGGNFDPEQMRRFQEMRERFANGGGRGFGGDWRGGRDNDDDGDRRGGGDFGRGMWGGGFGGGGWQGGDGQDGNRDRNGESGDSRNSSTAKTERKPRPRYTVDLPDLFDSVDSDQDGQVGLYEWKKSKRGLADFRKIDRDGDGFLTPTELVRAESIPSPSTTNVAAARPAASVDGATPVTVPGPAANGASSAVAATAPAVIEVDASNPLAMEAKKMFSLLDADRDGSVSESEWRKSVKLKPLFEQLGVDLKQPMDSTTFVSHYVQIKTPRG